MNLLIPLFLTYISGPTSTYWPGDGYNEGTKSCGGRLSYQDTHVALRNWRKLGCGTRLIVCSRKTQKCILSTVGDSGPWGCIKDGFWKMKLYCPSKEGWKRRAVVDLSPGAWRLLGMPSYLSRVDILVIKNLHVGVRDTS